MGKEFELKYQASPEQIDSIHRKFGPFRTIAMETVYFDTPGRELSARRWMLRRRLENSTFVCTLKTPGENGVRGEWELPCDDILLAIPELCKLGAPPDLESLVHQGLVRVCGARFTRLACQIETHGCMVELALDRGALLGGGRELPLCEVEVELKEGSEEAAAVFADTLAAEFGLQPEHRSKFKRALSLVPEK